MEQTFKVEYSKLYNVCLDALKHLDMRITYKNKDKGLIQAKANASILSWGEDIDIKLKRLGGKNVKVKVSSEANSQLFSWGKNDRNEEGIFEEIERRLKR